MKITHIESYPVWTGRRNALFVVVDTDEGIYGIGESGISWREAVIVSAIEHVCPLLIGQDPFQTEHLWQLLYRGGFFPAQGIMAAAISALDIALWDIKGKALGVPVYQLLGGQVRDRVVCYPHCDSGNTLENSPLVEDCLRHKEEGWKFVRWNFPQDGNYMEPRQFTKIAIDQVQAVREAVGEEIEILLDVHTRLDLPDAVWLCNEILPLRPFFVEDALRSENANLYRALRQHTQAPLAAGEQYNSKWEFRQLIEEDLIDYARVDLCIAGGLTEGKKIAGWCETHHIKLVCHNPLGPVASAACLHLHLATINFGVQEQPRRPGTEMLDVFPVQVEWENGFLLPPEKPGLGVEFDREAAKKHPARTGNPPLLQRRDGSFTNW